MEPQLLLNIPCDMNLLGVNDTNSLGRICRTCLTDRGELRSLFEDRVNEMLMSFTSVQVDLNDGLPINICAQCVLHVSRAYNFKQQAETSESTLRQYLTNYSNTVDPVDLNYDISTISDTITDGSSLIIDDSNPNFYDLPDKSEIDLKSDLVEVLNSEVQCDIGEVYVENKHNLFVTPEENTEIFEPEKVEIALMNEDLSRNDLNIEQSLNSVQVNKEERICEVCSYICQNNEELKSHSKTHTNPKDHICNLCRKRFRYKVGLRSHMRTHGIGEKKYLCSQCGKGFYEPSELTIHMRVHTGEKPVICESCGKSFADPRSLAKHLKIHTGIKNYECDVCKKRFIHAYTLTAHKRTHTGEKPFVCYTCGYACATSTQLTLHNRTHTREKPYTCTQCQKSFASRSGLSTHELTHTGQRKYICAICGKGARTSTDLASHLRTHTGEKPYSCKVSECPKRYRTHSQLSAHMRTHTDCPLLLTYVNVDIQEDEDILDLTMAEDYTRFSNWEFMSHFRLSKSSVEMLIREIGSAVIPTNPRRPAVHVNTAMLLFLWALTHNEAFRKIADRFEIGKGHAHRVFMAMCLALSKKLDKFIKWPRGKEIIETIEDFRNIGTSSNFPSVIGSMDFIHIPVPEPTNYFNENGFPSVILQGICNAKMEFIDIYVDGTLNTKNPFVESEISKKLTKNQQFSQNYFVISGENYAPSNLLLTLSSKICGLKDFEMLFEEKFTIKSAFNILTSCFKRLEFVKVQKIEYARNIIVSCCILHNIFLRQKDNDDLTLELDCEAKKVDVIDKIDRGEYDAGSVHHDHSYFT